MIYAVIERGLDAGTASSFETWDQYHAATFSPYSTSAARLLDHLRRNAAIKARA